MRPTARLWETFAVVVMLGMTSSVCWATEETEESAKLPQVSGVITSVDALGGIVMLKESTPLDPATRTIAQPTSCLVDAKTVISKDQQPLSLADVRAGDQVMVEYATKDGKNVASSIMIQSPTAASSGSAAQAAKPAAASY